MKVLLISANTAVTPYPLYPLGCSMVAAAIQRAGHEVRQFDFLAQGGELSSLDAELREFLPALVGISVRNIDNVNYLNEQRYIDTVRKLVDTVRSISGAKVVLGGAGFSLVPEHILNATGADWGVVGEGEALFVDLVRNAEQGVYPATRLIGPETRLAGQDIPSALYDPSLMSFYLKSGNIASIQTKRGCTHRCVYCSYPSLEGPSIRRRDPASVADDIERLTGELGVKYIFFIDSVFNDDEGAYLDIVREMKRRGLNVPWTAFIKPVGLTNEIISLMRETGFASAEIGSDAATDTTLKGMGKGFTFQDIVACNDMLARHGVASAHFYMFGGPGETPETVREGIANIRALQNCAIFVFMGVRILPGTALARLAIKEGVIAPDQALLDSAYYFAPGLDKQWLELTLTEGFKGLRHVVFPPDALDDKLSLLHKLGYSGSLWSLLKGGNRKAG